MKVKSKYYILAIALVILLVVTVVLFKTKQSQEKSCVRCNILLLDIDTFRADELPCYGYYRNTAPNICSFAKKSIIFSNNYSPSFWTLPSIFSTITSLVPTFHQIRTSYIDTLSPQIPTLAEVLHQEGYQTFFVGDYSPALLTPENGGMRGYDQIITNQSVEQVVSGLSESSKPWFVHSYYPDLHMPYLLPDGVKPMENLVAPPGLPITGSDFDRLLNIYLKNHIPEVFQKITIEQYHLTIFSSDQPNSVTLTKLFHDLADKDERKYLINSWLPTFNAYMQSFDQNNAAHVAFIRMLYDTKIKLIDDEFKSLFSILDSRPLSRNTITVIMSDHGEALGEHGLFNHVSDHHSELFHTPLIIYSPGFSDKRIEQPTSNIDIFPTLLELTGSKPLTVLQGQSLIPYFGNQKNNTNRFIWSEDGEGLILQNRDWLYYLPHGATDIKQSILYNKTADPLEKNNVATNSPDFTKRAFEQASLLDSYNTIYSETKPIPDYNQIKLDPEKVKRLQKEGYF